MYINVENPEHYKFDVIDLNSGARIPGVQFANDETGDFGLFLEDYIHQNYIDKWNPITESREAVIFKFKGNIKIVQKEVEK